MTAPAAFRHAPASWAGPYGPMRRGQDPDTGAPLSLWAWPSGAGAPAAPVHPNALRVWRLVEEDAQSCLVTETSPGPSLEERLRAGPPLSLSEALSWLRELGGVLDLAHRQAIVHGRIQEQWIWPAASGHVKLLWPAGPPAATADDDRRDFAALAGRLLEPYAAELAAARPVLLRAQAGRFPACQHFLASLDGALWIRTGRPPELSRLEPRRRIYGDEVVRYVLLGGSALAALAGTVVWLLTAR